MLIRVYILIAKTSLSCAEIISCRLRESPTLEWKHIFERKKSSKNKTPFPVYGAVRLRTTSPGLLGSMSAIPTTPRFHKFPFPRCGPKEMIGSSQRVLHMSRLNLLSRSTLIHTPKPKRHLQPLRNSTTPTCSRLELPAASSHQFPLVGAPPGALGFRI